MFSFAYDLWETGYPCGTGSANGTDMFTDQTHEDYSLTAGSAACDFVPTSQPFATPDIAGTARPDSSESFVDAGAYESCP